MGLPRTWFAFRRAEHGSLRVFLGLASAVGRRQVLQHQKVPEVVWLPRMGKAWKAVSEEREGAALERNRAEGVGGAGIAIGTLGFSQSTGFKKSWEKTL